MKRITLGFLFGFLLGAGLVGIAGRDHEPSGVLVDIFNQDSISLDVEGDFEAVLNHFPDGRNPSGVYKARRIPLTFRLKIIKPREWNYKENGKKKEKEPKAEKCPETSQKGQ